MNLQHTSLFNLVGGKSNVPGIKQLPIFIERNLQANNEADDLSLPKLAVSLPPSFNDIDISTINPS